MGFAWGVIIDGVIFARMSGEFREDLDKVTVYLFGIEWVFFMELLT